jgi:hypothetical protein
VCWRSDRAKAIKQNREENREQRKESRKQRAKSKEHHLDYVLFLSDELRLLLALALLVLLRHTHQVPEMLLRVIGSLIKVKERCEERDRIDKRGKRDKRGKTGKRGKRETSNFTCIQSSSFSSIASTSPGAMSRPMADCTC